MKIAITGGSGFLGRHLIESFLSGGHQVVGLTRDQSCRQNQPGLVWLQGQLGDSEMAGRLLDGCDAVVHAALDRGSDGFRDHPADPLGYYHTNVNGSLQLINRAATLKLRRFVFISSGAVHEKVLGNDQLPGGRLDETHPLWPASLYGACKAAVETLIHAYGLSGRLSACTLRPTSIYGLDQPPDQSKWWELIRNVSAGQKVSATGGGKTVHVADVAAAARLLVHADANRVNGETFLCCHRMISDHEVAEIAKDLSGSNADIRGAAKTAGTEIDTSKLRSLGFDFGGDRLLHQTIGRIIDCTGVSTT